jgi:hypothetical protein
VDEWRYRRVNVPQRFLQGSKAENADAVGKVFYALRDDTRLGVPLLRPRGITCGYPHS